MALPITSPIEPMLSQLEDDIPEGEGWLYEPKWDGFRAIVFRDGDSVHLQSREGKALERYFPELPPALREALPERCVVDGEIVLPGPRGLDFDALQQRIHPAASRIEKLSKETPASFVAFDLLALGDQDLQAEPLSARRAALERSLAPGPRVFITPQTAAPEKARKWFVEFEGAGMDGVVAKRADLRYQPGERVMVKVKHERTVDCVVGGYRLHKQGGVGSLLLGLYDEHGVLHHVGHTSSFSAKERKVLLEKLQPLVGSKSFGEGRTPGGPSRWNSGRDMSWTSLAPSLVVEVSFDYLQGDRFRHAARLLRWRVDKAPEHCTFDQIKLPEHFSLENVVKLAPQ